MKLLKALIVFLILVILPVINADIIMPGEKVVTIENKIININDFPDYAFIAVKSGPISSESIAEVVGVDGVIPNFYKFTSVSVYALKKEKLADLPAVQTPENIELFLLSSGAVKVISGLQSYKTVPDSSPQSVETKNYVVNLNKTINADETTQPDSISPQFDETLYIGLTISIIALIGIAFILYNRRARK